MTPEENISKENRIVEFFETVNSIPIPGWIKKNVLTSLGKGVGNIIIAGLDLPTAWFESKSREMRAKSTGNEEVQKNASKEVSKLFTTNSDLANRALNYYAEDIVNKQINREDISFNFINQLKDQKYSNTPAEIDLDWLNTFWNLSETKSKDDIKLILGKVLAKEATNPSSISLSTLHLIPYLTSDTGLAFQKLCNISIKFDNTVIVVHPNIIPFMSIGELTEYDISVEEQTQLEGIGLIRSINVIPLNIIPDNGEFEKCEYAGLEAKFNFSDGVKVVDFTRSGRELRDLLTLEPNPKYTEYLESMGEDKFQLV